MEYLAAKFEDCQLNVDREPNLTLGRSINHLRHGKLRRTRTIVSTCYLRPKGERADIRSFSAVNEDPCLLEGLYHWSTMDGNKTQDTIDRTIGHLDGR
ncbi:hypothetical protein VTK26DRAFT_3194 [Humicola hyalothermophila]